MKRLITALTATAILATTATVQAEQPNHTPRPELGTCSAYGPSRIGSQIVGTTRCTTGTGRQYAYLKIRTSTGTYLSDRGPCVARNYYSQAVINTSSAATVISFGPYAC